jgi:outer membrane protein assembly factor BamB
MSTPDGRGIVLTGHGVDAGDVVMLDAHTGDPRWTWRPERDGGPCDVNGVAVAEDTVAVALRCRAEGVEDVVVGLSSPDGRERWAWPPSYDREIARGDELSVTGLAGGVVVQFGVAPRHAVFLAADGVAGQAYGAQNTGIGTLATIVGTVAVYYDAGTDGADITAVNARDGSPAWHTRVSSLIGWQLVAAAATPARAYLLLTTRQPETASGPLHVVALDRATGAVLGDHGLACGTSCQQSTIAADDHSVVVSARDPAPHTATLFALS